MEKLIVFGDGVDRGTYLLRMRATAVNPIQFGRFNKGRPIVVPDGDYVYVGSALRGLSSRVIRHSSRSEWNDPHPIRHDLLALFPIAKPIRQKKLYWHIDYLLEATAVALTQIYLIHHPARLEDDLAEWLNTDPHTIALADGLGASDGRNGRSHLLRVSAPESWWQEDLSTAVTALCTNFD